jgi:alanyl-tRNA synthetase
LQFGEQRITITDTKKENDLIIHWAAELPNDVNASVSANIDESRRRKITRHHSVTHLMHAALRDVLGTHVAQKGSLVNDDNLRFDFSHFAKMSDEEIAAVEKIVNRKIRQNIPVVIKEMPKEEALKLGAMALFGEKYGDTVRVVIMDEHYSIELCGGTHVGSTGELNLFKIISEGAVAAGVRRVEALAGCKAEAFINSELEKLNALKAEFKNPKDIVAAVQQMADEKSRWQKQAEQLEQRFLQIQAKELLPQVETVSNTQFLGAHVEVSGGESLRNLAFEIRNRLQGNYVVCLTTVADGKSFVVLLTNDDAPYDCSKWIKETVAPLINGGGGGKKSLATAGGQNASQLPQVIAAIKASL